jgi:hypothetical protein
VTSAIAICRDPGGAAAEEVAGQKNIPAKMPHSDISSHCRDAVEDIVLLQFYFYLDAPEGHRLAGDTITYDAATIDLAVGHAEKMLEDHTFSFGKANLCLIKDEYGHVLREVRGRRK